MVWFESAKSAISNSKKNGSFFIAFIDDHSELAKILHEKLMNNKISQIIDDQSCYRIDTYSFEWKKFQIAFSCDAEPQLVLISPGKDNINFKFDGDVESLINLLEEAICKKVSNMNDKKEEDKMAKEDKRINDKPIKAKIKFSENENIWTTEFDKSVEFGDVRSHVAEVLKISKSEFSLISSLPKHVYDVSEDTKTLVDLSVYPSCYIHVKINNCKQQGQINKSFNIFGSIYGLFTAVISVMFSLLFLNFLRNSDTTDQQACEINNVHENSNKIQKSGDSADDDEIRKTDNGNTTLLM